MKEQFMKERFFKGSIWLVLGLHIMLPVGRLLLKQVGYELLPGNEVAYAILCGLVSVVAVYAVYHREEAEEPRETEAGEGKEKILEAGFICLPFFVLWHLICMLIISESVIAKVIMFGVAVLGLILSEKLGKEMWLRNAGIVIAVIALIFIGFLGGLSLLWGGSANAVEKRVFSTEGTYYAEVISNDQGALGGATYVDVYETRNIPLLVYRVKRAPIRIYCGRWGEFLDMEIYWKTDKCLVINGEEYLTILTH